jgi:hypothetical protein
VNPVLSPAGCQTYDLFWTNSRNDDWYRAMRAIGIETGLSPRSVLRIDPSAVALTAAASNPYQAAPFAFAGTVIDAAVPPGPLASVHCHVGPRGLVRQTYDHQISPGGGVADVSFGRSPLWVRLGAADTTVPAVLFRFTWTGTIEIVAGT